MTCAVCNAKAKDAARKLALEMGRGFVGFELKPSYYDVAVGNLETATKLQQGLFSEATEATA